MIRVILLMDYSSEHDRKLLRGMMRYSKENGPWQFYRPSPVFLFRENPEEWAIRWAKEWKADAIIGRWDESKLEMLKDIDIPIVLQNNKSRSRVLSNLTGDYFATGQMAAKYFIKKCFANFAFFGLRGIVWSEERCKGYENKVRECNGTFYSYFVNDHVDDTGDIARWLRSLPKPIALFCCDDSHALLITEICKINNVDVPDQVAVLGVDDDELLCSISDPPISSIRMDVENGGYLTCQLLHESMRINSNAPFNVSIKPLAISERASTMKYDISDKHVLDIVTYIDEHYSEDIRMEHLLKRVPMSRRSIEIRFKKSMHGCTIYQYLLQVRVNRMAEMLVSTDMVFSDIVYHVGFRDIANVSRIFRRYKGCSPTEYRDCFKV